MPLPGTAHKSGPNDEVTNGELMRACVRIEGKVDKQGEAITGIHTELSHYHSRLAVVEVKQTEEGGSRGPSKKTLLASGGVGAVILGIVQWIIDHWSKATP